jgi:hypothetical protein
MTRAIASADRCFRHFGRERHDCDSGEHKEAASIRRCRTADQETSLDLRRLGTTALVVRGDIVSVCSRVDRGTGMPPARRRAAAHGWLPIRSTLACLAAFSLRTIDTSPRTPRHGHGHIQSRSLARGWRRRDLVRVRTETAAPEWVAAPHAARSATRGTSDRTRHRRCSDRAWHRASPQAGPSRQGCRPNHRPRPTSRCLAEIRSDC